MDHNWDAHRRHAIELSNTSPRRAVAALKRLHNVSDIKCYSMAQGILASITVDPHNLDRFTPWITAGLTDTLFDIAMDDGVFRPTTTERSRMEEARGIILCTIITADILIHTIDSNRRT